MQLDSMEYGGGLRTCLQDLTFDWNSNSGINHCGSLSIVQCKPRTHKSSPALYLTHLGAPGGLLGLPQGYWGQTIGGEEQLPTVSMALSTTMQGRGETEGIGLGSSACSRRGQPFLLSLHLVRCAWSLLTAQLENVTSLERFPRALPGSQPPRQAPSSDLFFANPAASWMAGRLPAQRIVSREPPHRWLGYPCLDASARVPAGGSGGAPRGAPLALPPRPGPALTCAAPGAAADAIRWCRGCNGRHRAVRAVRGAGSPWPAPPRAAPRRRTATRADGGPSRSVVTRPLGVPPAGNPPLALRAPAATRDPRSALVRPPVALRPLRPAEWPGLLAAGAAQGRREAGSARISINLGPRRELRQPPPRRQPPAPAPS